MMKIGILMDPLANIKPRTDSTLALMLAAQDLKARLFFFTPDDISLHNGKTYAGMSEIGVTSDETNWHKVSSAEIRPLAGLDIILMRKDPPVDKRFIHTCYMLEAAQREGVRVVNDPVSLLKYNEKLYATHFPEFCPEYIITASLGALHEFWRQHGTIIIKPLDAMGGQGVFLVEKDSVNFDVIWELQTNRGTYPVVAQKFIPEIADGDKRILVIGGEPFDHALVRLPKSGSVRGNLVHGGGYEVRKLNKREREIAETVGNRLAQDGVEFAGIDVIGDYLIEVNITSPTGIRQLSKETGEDLGLRIMKRIMNG